MILAPSSQDRYPRAFMPRTVASTNPIEQAPTTSTLAREFPGIEDELAAKLEKLNLRSWFDLVLHLPLRYEDETRIVPRRAAPFGEDAQIEATVIDAEIRYSARSQLPAQSTRTAVPLHHPPRDRERAPEPQ
jgi:RecG-like helicase